MAGYLSKNLQFLRLSKGLTQTQLSKLIGVPNKNLSDYERGKSVPPEEIAKKIEKFYKVTHEELFRTNLSKNVEIIIQNIQTLVAQSGLPIDKMMDILSFTISSTDPGDDNPQPEINEYRQMIINKTEPDPVIMENVYSYMNRSGYSESQIETFESEYLDPNFRNLKELKILQKQLSEKSPDKLTTTHND